MTALLETNFHPNNFNNFNNINDFQQCNNFQNNSNNSFFNSNINCFPNMMKNNMYSMNNYNMMNQNNMMLNTNSINMNCYPNQINNMNNFNMNNMTNTISNMRNDLMNKNNNINLNNNNSIINGLNNTYFNNMNVMNNYMMNNNINNIQPMFNGTNSMNNIESNFCLKDSINNTCMNNNSNMMNNNLYNSMNMNFNNPNCLNNFIFMNNYFNNNFSNNNMNLSNSFNNITLSKKADDFSQGICFDLSGLSNTCKLFLNEINIIFAFTTTQTINFKAKSNERLSDILNRFKNNSQCPEKLKNEIFYCYHNGSKVYMDKTLEESGIKDGDRILIIIKESKKDENDKEDEKENKIENNNLSLVKLSSSGIIIKEHIHNLVYCINTFNWKCNLCKIKYDKLKPKYFCSLCNYSMCENCHNMRNYPKKKEFPDNIDNSNITINKKYLKTVYHKHILYYSRTSRDSTELKQWYCNNCQEEFENDVWSFYCTKCDYDLCKKCAGFT